MNIVNFASAMERVGGDPELLEEVAKLFLETSPELLTQIRQAVESRNAQALERAAHTLKGSAANFGADAAVDAALQMEKMGRAGQLEGVQQALATLEAEMIRLRPALLTLARLREIA